METNEYNVSTAPKETLKNMVLLARNNCLYEIQEYKNYKFMNAQPPNKAKVMSSIYSLFNFLKVAIKKENETLYHLIRSYMHKEDIEDFILAFDEIDDYLYSKKLTVFDDGDMIDGW